MSIELSSADKKALRALGHSLKATVFIGKEGLSSAVLSAIEQAHEDHELLKVKVLESSPEDRKDMAQSLQEKSGSTVVQLIGRTVLLYRPHPDEPQIQLPSNS